MAITRQELNEARMFTVEYLNRTGIVLTEKEQKEIEVADFGLNNLKLFGAQIVTYINTDRCCAKEIVLMPGQVCPEHRHPAIAGEPGKEETFRCRSGEVYLYVEGDPIKNPKAEIPDEEKSRFTVWHEVILKPGEQYTLQPDTPHWFQGGPDGAVVSEFSTTSRDEADIFTDIRIQRMPNIK